MNLRVLSSSQASDAALRHEVEGFVQSLNDLVADVFAAPVEAFEVEIALDSKNK